MDAERARDRTARRTFSALLPDPRRGTDGVRSDSGSRSGALRARLFCEAQSVVSRDRNSAVAVGNHALHHRMRAGTLFASVRRNKLFRGGIRHRARCFQRPAVELHNRPAPPLRTIYLADGSKGILRHRNPIHALQHIPAGTALSRPALFHSAQADAERGKGFRRSRPLSAYERVLSIPGSVDAGHGGLGAQHLQILLHVPDAGFFLQSLHEIHDSALQCAQRHALNTDRVRLHRAPAPCKKRMEDSGRTLGPVRLRVRGAPEQHFLCSASGVSSDLQLPGTAARLEVRPALPRHGSGLLVRRRRFAADRQPDSVRRFPPLPVLSA